MREIASIASMRCDQCGVLVRSFAAQKAHSVGKLHSSWSFFPVEVRGLYCASCDVRCGSERVADNHAKETGHGEFIVKNTASNVKRKGKAASSSSSFSIPGDGLRELAPPDVDHDLLQTLTRMGYSQESATRAIFSCGPISVDGLVEWITEHRGDPDINTPLLVPTMPKWTNLVTDEMKIRSQKIREQAVWKANQRKDNRNRNRNRRETITMNAPNLYSRRLLKDLKTLSDKRREELKREFFIVEDMDDHILEDEIDQALEQCDPNMGEFSFELPSRSDSAYVYSDELMQICLKRDKTYTCSTKSKKHRQKAKRIGLTFLLVKGLIKRGEAIRLRWVYYLDPVTYGDQNNSNEAVACMSLICGATRSSFHIRPFTAWVYSWPRTSLYGR